MKKQKYISCIEYEYNTPAYLVRLDLSKERIRKLFTYGKYGGKHKALKAAFLMACRYRYDNCGPLYIYKHMLKKLPCIPLIPYKLIQEQ